MVWPMHAASMVTRQLRLAVTGSTGFIGNAVVRTLRDRGHAVARVDRGEPGTGDTPRWDPGRADVVDPRLEALDGLIHCAGAGIADRRWTSARKALLRSSRVDASRNLSEAVATLQSPPGVLVQCGAIGWYGHGGDRVLTESDPPGTGYLAQLCADWEHATASLEQIGVRRVILRLGMVLGAGGAMAKMAPIFRRGLGGRLGSGRQWMSWIAMRDVMELIHRSVTDERLSGPFNAVAPAPVTNAAFTSAMAAAWGRPARLPVPALALKLAVGGMAGDVLLASQRCRPNALENAGFTHHEANLAHALQTAIEGLRG